MVVGQRMPNSLAILIPCRLNSRRLPGKALINIGAKALIHHVYDNTYKALNNIKADIFVCTDSIQIINYLKIWDIPYIQTSSSPINGTERIAEAVITNNLEYDFYIDVQGDEPFVNNEIIKCVSDQLFKNNKEDEIIVLPHQKIGNTEASRVSTVKLVTDEKNRVLYMSRAKIPFIHDKEKINMTYKKHLSVIGFTKKSLEVYACLSTGKIEAKEDIELLRALEHGIVIMSPLSTTQSFSIDIQEDLEKARKLL